MKLWVIRQTVNNCYNTYDSAVVAAETAEEAQRTHPCGQPDARLSQYDWTKPENVTVELIGEAHESVKAGVVLASFNAG